MWRPKDWKNPYKILIESQMEIRPSTFDSLSPTDQVRYMGMSEGYESGANAMLEKLRATGHVSGEALRNTKARGWLGIDLKSKWYCIPDEETK